MSGEQLHYCNKKIGWEIPQMNINKLSVESSYTTIIKRVGQEIDDYNTQCTLEGAQIKYV